MLTLFQNSPPNGADYYRRAEESGCRAPARGEKKKETYMVGSRMDILFPDPADGAYRAFRKDPEKQKTDHSDNSLERGGIDHFDLVHHKRARSETALTRHGLRFGDRSVIIEKDAANIQTDG